MQIMYDEPTLIQYVKTKIRISPQHPLLIDQYLMDAIEVDVDAISDGNETIVAGIMQHVENAGIHSGDSACSLPPYSLEPSVIQTIQRTRQSL